MNPAIEKFLKENRVCVLSVLLEDKTPHSATVHYSSATNPFKIYVQTENTTLKVQPFKDGQAGPGAIVIGFDEDESITLQLHGTVRSVTNEKELEKVWKIHFQKHPDAEKYKGPKTVFLEFTPTWWRYTDFNTDPDTIIEDSFTNLK